MCDWITTHLQYFSDDIERKYEIKYGHPLAANKKVKNCVSQSEKDMPHEALYCSYVKNMISI